MTELEQFKLSEDYQQRAVFAPLVWMAAAALAGIICGRYLGPFSDGGYIAALAAVTALTVTVPMIWRRENRRGWVWFAGALAITAVLGAWRYELAYWRYEADHVARYVAEEPRLVSLRGRIVTTPYVQQSRGDFVAYNFMNRPATILVLACEEVLLTDGWGPTQGLVRVTVDEPALHLQRGQRVELEGWLAARGRPSNPGEYDLTDINRSRRVLAVVRLPHIEAARVLDKGGATGILSRGLGRWRDWATAAVLAGAETAGPDSTDQPAETLLAALLLGQRHLLDDAVMEQFVQVGTLHFLALSGLHVGLFTALVWRLGVVLGWRRWGRGLLALTLLGAYLLLVPPRPPVLRAALGTVLFCVAYMSRRRVDAFNLLGAVVLLLAFWRPIDVFGAGWQLSVIVTAAILVLAPAIYRHSPATWWALLRGRALPIELDGPRWEAQLNWAQRWRRRGQRWLWQLTVVCAVAWLAGMPLGLWHFQRATPWGLPASIALSLLVAATVTLGIGKLWLVGLAPGLAVAAAPATWMAQAVIWTNGLFARLPGTNIATGRPPWWFVAAFYVCLAGGAWSARHSWRGGRWLAAAIGVWLVVLTVAAPFAPDAPAGAHWACHVLAVGHGNAVMVELPDGRVLGYDAGSLGDFALGRRVVLPFVRRQGWGGVDALVISHAHIDHYVGTLDICRALPVGKVWLNAYFDPAVRGEELRGANRVLMTALEKMQQPTAWAQASSNVLPPKSGQNDYTLEVLWPIIDDLPAETLAENDTSVVMRINGPGGSLLLAGDIEPAIQERLVQFYGPERLRATVLLIPHQGSVRGQFPGFIEAVAPEVVLNSSGRLDTGPRTQLEEIVGGRPLWHTFESGALSVYFTDDGPVVWTFR